MHHGQIVVPSTPHERYATSHEQDRYRLRQGYDMCPHDSMQQCRKVSWRVGNPSETMRGMSEPSRRHIGSKNSFHVEYECVRQGYDGYMYGHEGNMNNNRQLQSRVTNPQHRHAEWPRTVPAIGYASSENNRLTTSGFGMCHDVCPDTIKPWPRMVSAYKNGQQARSYSQS